MRSTVCVNRDKQDAAHTKAPELDLNWWPWIGHRVFVLHHQAIRTTTPLLFTMDTKQWRTRLITHWLKCSILLITCVTVGGWQVRLWPAGRETSQVHFAMLPFFCGGQSKSFKSFLGWVKESIIAGLKASLIYVQLLIKRFKNCLVNIKSADSESPRSIFGTRCIWHFYREQVEVWRCASGHSSRTFPLWELNLWPWSYRPCRQFQQQHVSCQLPAGRMVSAGGPRVPLSQ